MPRTEELVAWVTTLRQQEADRGARLFLGIPCRWLAAPWPKYRCANDHVSTCILKSEVEGDLCLVCHEPVVMTFPEDKDGPRP